MKKYFSLVLSLTASAILITSCQSDNNESVSSITQAKPVVFADVPDEVVESEPTGNVIDGNKKELREVVRKQQVLSPVQLIDGSLSEVVYPGCVLRGDAFMEGEYTPIAVKNPQPITLSASLNGKDLNVSQTAIPTLSNVRQAINNLMYPNVGEINYQNASSYIDYSSNEVTTTESFNKTFQIHTKVNVLAGIIKAKFGFETRKFSLNKKHYVLVKARQQFYNISVDPKQVDQWGEMENVGEYEPVYISSVDYGRVVSFLVETTESADSIKKMIEGGISVAFKKIGGSVEASYSKQWNRYFKEEKMHVLVAGGPWEYARKAQKSYEGVMDFLEIPGARNIIESCVPISYRVRSLRTNREIEVKNFYTEERFVPEKR